MMTEFKLLITAAVSVSFVVVSCISAGLHAKTVGPFYHEESGSYFELVDLADSYPAVSNKNVAAWYKVRDLAARRVHQGRHGRLAIVDTQSKHRFLQEKFDVREEAWIGLRYFCQYQALMWVTGEIHHRTGFSAWAPRWNVHGGSRTNQIRVKACTNYLNYYPVHYWPEKDGFLWNANGTFKHFGFFFVEYPPIENARDN